MISVPEEGPKEEAIHTHQLSGASLCASYRDVRSKGTCGGLRDIGWED